jgi:hypothetical protein
MGNWFSESLYVAEKLMTVDCLIVLGYGQIEDGAELDGILETVAR